MPALEERCISVLAYNFPTIMAERLETAISRGDQNSRLRDYCLRFSSDKPTDGVDEFELFELSIPLVCDFVQFALPTKTIYPTVYHR